MVVTRWNHTHPNEENRYVSSFSKRQAGKRCCWLVVGPKSITDKRCVMNNRAFVDKVALPCLLLGFGTVIAGGL